MKKILILNGSLTGKSGNTQFVIETIQNKILKNGASSEVVHLDKLLNKEMSLEELETKLKEAHGFVFTSGTYWDSWGSPMQNFLEMATAFETSDLFLGKPAAVVITMHSVGGKGVLSRLQGVLNTMGIMIPPMSGMVYSLAGHLALQTESSFADDFWSLEDSETVIFNLISCVDGKNKFRVWPVDKSDPKRIWIK